MKIIVTGCYGFIGFNFIRYIIKNFNSDFKIIGIDNLNNSYSKLNFNKYKSDEFTFLNEDINKINDIENNNFLDVDLIINFAAESHVDTSIYNPEAFIHSNVSGVQSLLNFAKNNSVHNFIQISTDEVYGSTKNGFFTEDDKLNPSSPYSASKASADMLINAYKRTFDMQITTIRPANNYGPFQQPEKLIPFSISNLLQNKKIEVYGKGENVRHWLYVEDTVEAILKVVEVGLGNDTYNLGSGDYLSNNETANKLLEVGGYSNDMIEYIEDRPGHDFRYATNCEKINSLGWKPKLSFDEGLKNTYEWYIKNQDWLLFDISKIVTNRDLRFAK